VLAVFEKFEICEVLRVVARSWWRWWVPIAREGVNNWTDGQFAASHAARAPGRARSIGCGSGRCWQRWRPAVSDACRTLHFNGVVTSDWLTSVVLWRYIDQCQPSLCGCGSTHLEYTANWRRCDKLAVHLPSTVKPFFIQAVISWRRLLTSSSWRSLQ